MKRWIFVFSLLGIGMLIGTVATQSLLHGQPGKAPAVPRELTSYRDVVKQVLPAVVSIEARGKTPIRDRRREADLDVDPRRPQLDGKLRQGFGSGVVVHADGVILTNYHLLDGADEVVVQFKDGRKVILKDFKGDAKTDLAIIRVKLEEQLPFLRLGDSDAMEIGDRVLAVEAPFGLTGSVTHGIISGKGRSLRMNQYEDFLQTDAAINPGNSGGPLINLSGEVIGINTAIKSRTGGFQGVGLAIASNLAREVLGKLRKDGVVKRGYLGVQVQELNEAGVAERLKLPRDQKGVAVSRTLEGGPAARAGAKEGDVITAIAGRAVADGRDLQRIVADLPLDRPVKMIVLRDGQYRELDVTIEEQPADVGP